jgi:replicative DNA helicase
MSAEIYSTETEPIETRDDSARPKPKSLEQFTTEQLLSSVNRGLPASDEAEKGILSAMLQNTGGCLGELRTRIKTEMFYHPPRQIIFDTLCAMYDKNLPIDFSSLTMALRNQGNLDKVGGGAEITDLWIFTPVAQLVPLYQKTLFDKYLCRRGIHAHMLSAHELMEHGRGELDEPATDRLTQGEERVFAVVQEANEVTSSADRPSPVADVVHECLEYTQNAMAHMGQIPPGRMLTGWPDFDRATCGLEPGDLFLIGARPKMGKTVVLNTMVKNMTVDQNIPTLVLSLEMSKRRFLNRVLFGGFGIETSKAQTGFLSRNDQQKFGEAARTLSNAPLWIDDRAGHTSASIRATIREYVRKHGVKLVMLDYVQLVAPVTKRGKSEERHMITETMDMLHSVKKTDGVVIIALAQAKRGSEENPGSEPTPKDFDGGSAMEKYVDYGAFIHRPAKFKPWSRLKEEQQEAFKNMVSDRRKQSPHLWSEPQQILDGTGKPVFDVRTEIQTRYNEEQQCMEDIPVTVKTPKLEWKPELDWNEQALLLLCLNRNGDDGRIHLRFRKEFTRFEPRNDKLFSNNPNERQAERKEV